MYLLSVTTTISSFFSTYTYISIYLIQGHIIIIRFIFISILRSFYDYVNKYVLRILYTKTSKQILLSLLTEKSIASSITELSSL